ncbi:MAG: phosphatase PAP2 family protein [Eubacterium sp.]|nr:phosphatase PAP2 family protein [Eubacterium sp.]
MYPMLIFVTAALGDKIDSLFYGFDIAIYKIFGAVQNGVLTQVAKIFTAFGDENFVIPLAVLGVVLCFFKKTRKYGFALIFAIAIGTLVTNVIVKPMALRIRPYNTLQNAPIWGEYKKWYQAAGALSESDYSFPSGHTTAAFEIAIAMALCFRSEGKKALSWVFPVIAVLVMCSRVYLMVHYPSDVIGGFIVGTCAGAIAFFLSKAVCKLFEKPALDKIDLERISKKGFNPKVVTAVICVAVIGMFCNSYIPALSEGGDAKRCEYVGEYECNNEARVDDDKYYPLDTDKDGTEEYYCKIHWKQLNPEAAD